MILRNLKADGWEDLGTIALGGVAVVGDPAVLGRTPANGAYAATASRPGTWQLLGRAGDDPEQLAEIVVIHEDDLGRFWDAYDDAIPLLDVPADSGRLAILDARQKDDTQLRAEMFEPEDLPWVLDSGAVVAAPRQWLAHVIVGTASPATLIGVAFGPPAHSLPSAAEIDES
jgi:hypothetical protein